MLSRYKAAFLTTRHNILCTRRLQPPRDDYAGRVQWFSSVVFVAEQVDFGLTWLVVVLVLLIRC